MTDLFEIVEGKVIVTTSTGWRVECLPFGDDLMRAGTALAMPDKPEPPTYLLGNPDEDDRQIRVPYTDESINDSSVSAEDTEAWGRYVIARDEYNREVAAIQRQQALMRGRVLVYKATRVLDLPDLKAWAAERENFYGIPTPTDEREALFQFYVSEVSKTSEDSLALMSGVMKATGATEEVLDAFEANFRDSLGPQPGQDAQGDTEGTQEAKAA